MSVYRTLEDVVQEWEAAHKKMLLESKKFRQALEARKRDDLERQLSMFAESFYGNDTSTEGLVHPSLLEKLTIEDVHAELKSHYCIETETILQILLGRLVLQELSEDVVNEKKAWLVEQIRNCNASDQMDLGGTISGSEAISNNIEAKEVSRR